MSNRRHSGPKYDANGRRIASGGVSSSPRVSAMNFQATQVGSGPPLPNASFEKTQVQTSGSRKGSVDSTRAKVAQLEMERQERRRRMKEYRINRVAQVKRNEAMGRPGDVDFQNMIDEWRETKGGYPRAFGRLDLGNSRICVAIRTRPVNDTEKKRKQHEAVSCINPRVVVHECKFAVDGITKFLDNHEFEFDCTFGPQHNNDHVYATCVSPLVAQAFSGGKATCFAFGQTGSGKTYTMAGMQERAAEELFHLLNGDDDGAGDLTLHMSFFEICGVRCFDLLTPETERVQLPIREDGKGVIHVEGLSVHDLTEVKHMLTAIKAGNKRRKTSKTEVHDDSSRSHAIFQLYLRNANGKIVGKLSLCDLAGSERGSETKDHNKERRLEGAEINKSLLALKECIRALDFGLSHVPYRASKLTMILKDSFGPGSLTTMVSCISPTYAQQNHTLSTLRYTDLIKNKPVSKAAFDKETEEEAPSLPVRVVRPPTTSRGAASTNSNSAAASAAAKGKPKVKAQPKLKAKGAKAQHGSGASTEDDEAGKKAPAKKTGAAAKKGSGASTGAGTGRAVASKAKPASKLRKPRAQASVPTASTTNNAGPKKGAAGKKKASGLAAKKKSAVAAAAKASPPRKFNWRTNTGPDNDDLSKMSMSEAFGGRRGLNRSSKVQIDTGKSRGKKGNKVPSPTAKAGDFSDHSLEQMMAKIAAVEKMANPRKASLARSLNPETDMTMHDLIAQAKRNAAERRKTQLMEQLETPPTQHQRRQQQQLQQRDRESLEVSDLQPDPDENADVQQGVFPSKRPSGTAFNPSFEPSTDRNSNPSSNDAQPPTGGETPGGGDCVGLENVANRPETPEGYRDGKSPPLPQESLLEQEQELIDMHELHIHEHAKIVEAETHLLESVTGGFDYSIDDYTNKLRAILEQKERLTIALRTTLDSFCQALEQEEQQWQ